jgi:hypothetical protein
MTISAYSQNNSLYDWAIKLSEDLVEMNNLSSYSLVELPTDVKIDAIYVDKIKLISINQGLITFEVDHGKGIYCSLVSFRFEEINNNYFLIFSDITTENILGKEIRYVRPWVSKENICD